MRVKNKLTIILSTFAVLTVVSSLLNLLIGVAETSNFHILLRFLIVALAIGSLYIFDWLQHSPRSLVHLIHYVMTLTVVFLMTWLSGFYVQLHPDAYRDIFLNYTVVYILVTAVLVIYYRTKSS